LRAPVRQVMFVHHLESDRVRFNNVSRDADEWKWDSLFVARFGAMCASGWVGVKSGGPERDSVLTRGRLAGIVLQAVDISRWEGRLCGVARRLVRRTFKIATCLAQGNRPDPARMRSRHLGLVPCDAFRVRAKPCASLVPLQFWPPC
jgi:hypothetical protein